MPLMRYLQLDQKTATPSVPLWRHMGLALVPVLVLIIGSELATLAGLENNALVRLFIWVGSLTLTALAANSYGLQAGVMVAAITTFYIAYHFSLPGQLFSYTEQTGRALLVFCLAIVMAALTIGRLRSRLDTAMYSERQARNDAEDRQRQLEIILQQIPVGVIIVDMADHHISYSNKQAEELLGISFNKDMILGHHSQIALSNTDQSNVTSSDWPLDKVLQELETVSDEEIHYIGQDGQSADLRINAAPVYNAHHQPIAAIATILDISLAKELEQRKDEFISIASHELKTPVTSLKIYLQLLEKQVETIDRQALADLVQKANKQINRLSTMMADLLDLSRLQSGKTSYALALASLETVAKEVIEQIQPSTTHELRLEGQAPEPFLFDAAKIQQAVANLINNAIKYSDASQIITINLHQTQERTAISIEDKGIGIAPENQTKIFDLFYQENSTNKKLSPGLGIGLYVSNQIVASHQGQITVESVPGQGSTFTISLPRQQG